jgi:hypothetical protein
VGQKFIVKIWKAIPLGSDAARRRQRWPACAWVLAGCLVVAGGWPQAAQPQQQASEPMPEGAPLAWVQAAVDNELTVIAPEGLPAVRCRQRRIDAKGDTTRELIESREGTVARLVERNGQPLTPAEDADERQRLEDILAGPSDFLRHHQHDKEQREDAMKLVRLLPQAMVYSYVPGQPQPRGAQRPQVVIDYHPNPAFRPPTARAELLTGIEGRVWIDAQSHRMTRIEGRILRPIDFGYGLVAQIFPGGTIEFEQSDAGNGRWVYSHITENVTVRILMVKKVVQRSEATSWEFRLLPAVPHFQDAVRMLLEMKVPLSS